MRDYRNLTTLMERVVHKYNQVEKKKRYYGSNSMLLSRSEIHTIVAVGENLGVNVTTLAKIQGITKGAASQMIYKLVDKGFVEKKVSPESDTEVCLTLTDKGYLAFKKHQEYHEISNDQFFEMLRDMPDELTIKMESILQQFEKYMDERLKNE